MASPPPSAVMEAGEPRPCRALPDESDEYEEIYNRKQGIHNRFIICDTIQTIGKFVNVC